MLPKLVSLLQEGTNHISTDG